MQWCVDQAFRVVLRLTKVLGGLVLLGGIILVLVPVITGILIFSALRDLGSLWRGAV